MKEGSKRPLPPKEEGCLIIDGWSGDKHVYTMFGAPKECCVKCGKEHSMITEWRRSIVENSGGSIGHPYVVTGIWSLREYQQAMKRNG